MSVAGKSGITFFNPRLREGGDVQKSRRVLSQVFFNPRLREGGDLVLVLRVLASVFSIHASAKEATFEHLLRVLDEHIFQSTPPRRRRQCFRILNIYSICFQSTPPRRRRLRQSDFSIIITIFNPRLREGGDFPYASKLSDTLFFQSTPP